MSNISFGAVVLAGLPDAFGGVAAIGAMIILGMILAALGSYAYKQLRGDGVEWPDEDPEEPGEDDGLRQADSDDEWDYY
ncbi:MAG: hypothetical protein ACI8XM_001419 [Haloarculaceae archaeon]|jgi:hypothetical protein